MFAYTDDSSLLSVGGESANRSAVVASLNRELVRIHGCRDL